MTEQDEDFRLRPIDVAFLEALVEGRDEDNPWGRITPSIAADRIDYSAQHIITRTDALLAGGYVRKLDRGIYEITEKGIEAVEEE